MCNPCPRAHYGQFAYYESPSLNFWGTPYGTRNSTPNLPESNPPKSRSLVRGVTARGIRATAPSIDPSHRAALGLDAELHPKARAGLLHPGRGARGGSPASRPRLGQAAGQAAATHRRLPPGRAPRPGPWPPPPGREPPSSQNGEAAWMRNAHTCAIEQRYGQCKH